MNFYDIGLRYLLAYLLVMLGFVTQQLWVMYLGIPFILVAILGICPIFKILGIDHNNFEKHTKGEFNIKPRIDNTGPVRGTRKAISYY